MNVQKQSIFLFGMPSILVALLAFLGYQSVLLQNKVATVQAQCEHRLVQLQNTLGTPGKISKTINKTTTIYSQITSVNSHEQAQHFTAENAQPGNEQPKLQHYSESLEQRVRRKYRFLFSSADLDENSNTMLLQLLMAYEQIALKIRDAQVYGDELNIDRGSVADWENELEDINSQIEILLEDNDSRERYTLLVHSDAEQEAVGEYTLGLNSLFPLNTTQQETVLFTRLRLKQAFEDVLEQVGVYENYPLTTAEQQQIMQQIGAAAHQYKKEFLQGVRPNLEHDNYPMDQYTLLENYTNTEFEQLLTNIQQQIAMRGMM